MTHLILELILWILFAFFVGCIIGCILRKLFGGTTAVEAPARELGAVPATVAVIESPATSAAIETPATVITRKPEPKTAPAEAMEEPLPLVDKPARPRDRSAAMEEPLPLAAKPVRPRDRVAAMEEPLPLAAKPARPRDRAAVAEEPLPPTGKPARPRGVAAAMEEPLPPTGKPARPRGIAAARSGKADNLQRISGVGPKNEKTLQGLGFFHFDQIAAWTADEIVWVDDHLKFNGRIQREGWIKQARLLADGKEEEFRKLYGTGGLRNKKGETESGTRTRKS